MQKKRIYAIASAAILLFAIYANVFALSKNGSRGEEVRKIQTKLKNWGYYSGSVDGVYGWQTESAVRSFQKKNGLSVDGVAGTKTLNAMGIYSSSSSGGGSSSSSPNEANIELLARVINGEARGEPYEGQVAVGAVVLNRVDHPSFPNSISGVVYQKGAFTAVDDGQINAEMYASSRRAARDALNGWDPTGGAIYYYNPRTATNQWIRTREVICTIGEHVFCN
ncbi:MAG: spore cortex-lytic enzyme [Clostridia bacterium]|nr:spore cortex-lytic enzyme [Clostridia bacterium]